MVIEAVYSPDGIHRHTDPFPAPILNEVPEFGVEGLDHFLGRHVVACNLLVFVKDLVELAVGRLLLGGLSLQPKPSPSKVPERSSLVGAPNEVVRITV